MNQPQILGFSRQTVSSRVTATGRVIVAGRIVASGRLPISVSYSLRDRYSGTIAAGSVNGTLADTGQVRTLTDNNNKVSIGSGLLNFATGGAGVLDPNIAYPLQTRVSGKIILASVTPSDTNGSYKVGWSSLIGGSTGNGIYFASSGTIQIVSNGTATNTGFTYVGGTTYTVAIELRALGCFFWIKGGIYTYFTLIFTSLTGSDDQFPTISVITGTTSVFTIDDLRIPKITSFVPVAAVYDVFSRANGAIGSTTTVGPDGTTTLSQPYIDNGGTWTIASNVATNNPTQGSELLTDGALENWSSVTDLTSWTESVAGSSTINQETSIVQAGSNSARIDIDSSNTAASFRQVTGAANESWLMVNWWGRSSASGKTMRVALGTVAAINGATRNPGTSWNNYIDILRISPGSTNPNSLLCSRVNAASSSLYFDTLSTKVLTATTLFASVRENCSTNVEVMVDIASLTIGTQVGVAMNIDNPTNPQNFVLAYHDGTNLKIDKCIAGVYSNVQTTSSTFVVGATLRLRRFGISYVLTYNNGLFGSLQNISDSSLMNNTAHAMFNTYTNTISKFIIRNLGANNEYGQLDAF